MNQFMKDFAREFWTRMFWACVFVQFTMLTLYLTAPKIQF
jgi:hypothetical protein